MNNLVGPRKKRTRQHVIADLSVHHIEGFILKQGYTAQRLSSEYSYDLIMTTFDENGFAEPGSVYFQLKASESLRAVGTAYVFDIDIRDYNLWIHEEMPVILVVYDARRRKAFWVAIQEYFDDEMTRQPKLGAKSVRMRIPKNNAVNRRAIQKMRELKWSMQRPELGVLS